MTRAAFILACLLGFPGSSPAQRKAESVCQILGHLEDFSGQIVSVRARIGYLNWLEAEDCSVVIKVRPFDFRNVIATDWPDSPVVEASHFRVPFSTDKASGELLSAAVAAVHGINPKLYATVEGLIVTRDPPLALVLKTKTNAELRVGFGHLGMAPALMIVKRVSDAEIVRDREDGSKERIAIKPPPILWPVQ